ncbi:MAG: hypothetical protein EBS34_10420, partial [Flavobacteriales bacterium]|nr:hypothetical protein [Flavobacteriales bacterium]
MKILEIKFMRISLLAVFSVIFLSFCSFNESDKVENIQKPEPQTSWTSELFIKNNKLTLHEQERLFEKELILFKNDDNTLPIGDLSRKITVLSVGGNPDAFHTTLNRFANFEVLYAPTFDAISTAQLNQLKQASIAVFSLHSKDKNQLISEIPETIKNEFQEIRSDVLIVFGNSSSVRNQNFECFSSVVLAHENHEIAQRSTAQALLGALEIKGHQNGHLSMQTNGRLKFSTPQEVGIDSSYIKKIEEIALGGIKTGAYPGCQVLVAVNNKIILNNSYGYHTYEKNAKKVENEDLYDIASITKIAASTLLTMKLHSEGKFDLSKTLGDYLEETKNTTYSNVKIRAMMAHQAGFVPYIPFYNRTKENGQLKPTIYSTSKKEGYTLAVADNIFMKDTYVDSMYAQIYKTPRSEQGFKYSDLCFYFTKKIVENLIGESQHTYLLKNIYEPMGLRTMRYLPLNYFPKERITPTEKDNYFRNQLVQGYVHDQGAAMLGGVAGHAGLFSNAYDLACIMQLFLCKGNYGGKQYFSA